MNMLFKKGDKLKRKYAFPLCQVPNKIIIEEVKEFVTLPRDIPKGWSQYRYSWTDEKGKTKQKWKTKGVIDSEFQREER